MRDRTWRGGGKDFWWGLEAPREGSTFLLQAQYSLEWDNEQRNREEGGGGGDQIRL